MPQTLYVFLAMLVLVTFSVSQQRSVINTYQKAYEREVTMAATDFALQRFEQIRSKKYDENVSSDAMGFVNPASLTSNLGRESSDATKNDIDDYLDEEGEHVSHRLGGQAFDFFVVTKVRYDPETSDKQGKKVTLEVYRNEAAKGAGRFYVQMSRTYTISGVAV